jgi:3-hydroxyacyl-CoA dehydrogenase
MTILASLSREGRIGLLCIDNPPVNAISPQTVTALINGFNQFEAAKELDAVVIYGAGRTFVAGADIMSFELPDFSAKPYNDLLARIEASPRPVVAAMHGNALGAGLELALACHWRIAQPGTKLGLPEITLGLIPGSRGTQRLPRLVGAPLALDLILAGRMMDAEQALSAGLIDEVRAGDPRESGNAAAQALAAAGKEPRRSSRLAVPPVPDDLFAKETVEAHKKPAYPARAAVVRCVQAATELPFEAGEQIEAREFEALRKSPTSKALRHLFFAEREAGKIPGLPQDTQVRPIRHVGIVGVGTMGGGIAMNFVNAGIPTVVIETSKEALQRGADRVRKTYEASAAKGRLTTQQVEQRMSLLTGSLDYAALTDCDLLIEAVFEDLDLKKQVCARLGAMAQPGAIIATNTSTLDVNLLAEASGRPADVVGMHFFSPANVMRLLEVVRADTTAPDVLATITTLAKTIGKVAIVSGVCYGFIANRMAEAYVRETEFLLMEGAKPKQIDQVMETFGMAMGPCRVLDMAGVDVAAKTVIEHDKVGGLPPDPSYRAVIRKLFELGRFGQKTGAGYYRYEDGAPVPDPEVVAITAALAKEYGIPRRSRIGDEEIRERLLYPLINEGVRILDEGIAFRPGDIAVAWVAGYGFPDCRGGPMFMADQIGLGRIADRLAHYARICGNEFGYWTAAPLLARLAASGQDLAGSKLQ